MNDVQINYTSAGEPLKCFHCKSLNIQSKSVVIESGYISEREYFCGDCKSYLAYWAYGYFDPMYSIERTVRI
jgi:hypothetical protein